jgi:Protein of unknown function (DUF3551)
MRLLILSLLLAGAALTSAIDQASAQSPTSYPWCSQGVPNYRSCYFASKDQCMATISGIGTFCFQNPDYWPHPGWPTRGVTPRSN